MKKYGVTLLELLIVLIIIGVLTALAIPAYVSMRENSMNQQAVATMEQIAAAQRQYRLETGAYFSNASSWVIQCPNDDINRVLKLSLPACNSEYKPFTYRTANWGNGVVGVQADRHWQSSSNRPPAPMDYARSFRYGAGDPNKPVCCDGWQTRKGCKGYPACTF